MGSCYNSVTLNAPVGRVWDTVRNFHDLSWAPEVITSVGPVGDIDGATPGAMRILNGLFHETLISLSDDDKVFSYSIDDGPGPVSKELVEDYVGIVRLHSVTMDNTTFLEWESSYNTEDDEAVGAFCNPIYQALLTALKNHFG